MRISGSLILLMLVSVTRVLHALPAETEYLGTIIFSGLADDRKWGPFPIGFNFDFYGTTYDEFYVSSNGLVQFGSGSNAFNNVTVPNAINPNNYIAPFWDDLIIHSTGDIMYQTIGVSPNRKLVIQFNNMSFWTSGSLLGSFQVILYEGSNEIQIQYRNIIDLSSDRASGSEATVGLENLDGSGGILCSYNTAGYIYSGKAIRFTPNAGSYTYDDQALYDGVVLTDVIPKAGVPTLIAPGHNTIVGETVTFQWEAASHASSYFVVISQSSDLSSPVHTSADLTDLNYEFTLMPNQTYYWSANARNSEGTVTWSEIWRFQTSTSPPLLAVPQTINLELGDLYQLSLFYTGGDAGPKTATISSLPGSGTLYQSNGGSQGVAITTVPTVVTDAAHQLFYYANGAKGSGAGSFNFHFSDGTGTSPDTSCTIHVASPGVPVFQYAAKESDRVEITFDRNMADPSGKHLEFSVEDNGIGVTPTSCMLKTGGPSTIVLYVNPNLDIANTITVAYTRGTVTSEAGGFLETFDFQIAGKLAQDITFDPLPDRTFGDADFDLSATASSGLPVTFSSSNTAVVSISGTTATINNAGEAYIYATQTGDATYVSATSERIQLVNKAPVTVSLIDQMHDYTGSGIAADLTTSPGGLTVQTIYNGSTDLPVDLGSYSVVAEVMETNYSGSATATLMIADLSAPVPDVATLPLLIDECSITPVPPTATDTYSGTITGTTGTPFPITTQGTTVITWTYEDAYGNVNTQNQNVAINDISNPLAPTLSDQTVGCGETVSAPTTTDACAGTIEGTTSDPVSFTGQGTYVINWTFDDGNGNSVAAAQNVFVVDVSPPLTPVLADLTGDCFVNAVAPTATDACAGIITGTTTDPLIYTVEGTYTINWTFDDGNGNSIMVPQNVIVADLTPPLAPILSDLTGECSVTAVAPTTTDACAGIITGTTTDPLTYADQGSYVIHWTFDDGNGNSIAVLQNVLVDDVTPPVVTSLPDLTGECSVTAVAPTATDACAGLITGTSTDPLTYDTEGIHVITWTFDDGNGNSTDVTQNVILADETDPVVPSLPDLTGECSVTAVPPTTTDNCAGLVTGTTTDPMVYTNQGAYVINWAFDDGNGNIIYANQNVLVADQTPPTATAPSNAVTCDGRVNSIGLSGIADNCSTPVVTYTISGATTGAGSGSNAGSILFNPGISTVTYTVNDGNGNSSQYVVTVNYQVVEDIVVTVSGGTLTCENSGSYQWIRCEDNSIISGETGSTFQPDEPGDYAVILTQGSCSDTSACYSTNQTGIGDERSMELTIYPNPVHDYLTMETSDEQTHVTIRIVDMTGQVVQVEEVERFTRTELELRELKAGLYMIQIHSDQMNRVVRIIKK